MILPGESYLGQSPDSFAIVFELNINGVLCLCGRKRERMGEKAAEQEQEILQKS